MGWDTGDFLSDDPSLEEDASDVLARYELEGASSLETPLASAGAAGAVGSGFSLASMAGPAVGAVGSILGAYMQTKAQQEMFDRQMDFQERQFAQQKKIQNSQLATANRSQNIQNASAVVQLNDYILDRGQQQAGVNAMLTGLSGGK